MPTVTPRSCGSMRMDKSVLVSGETGVEIEAPSLVFLVEGEQTVLVDTAFGPLDVMDELHPGFDCRRGDDQTLEAVLANEGYAPDDVDAVVLSHLDWDHCYNLELFDTATTDIYVGRRELEYAVAPYPTHAYRYDAKSLGREPPWLTVDLTPLEGEQEVAPGVTVFPTPGHTVGHCSVAVETGAETTGGDGPTGETTVVAVDAIATFENLEGTRNAPFRRGLAMDELAWWESAREVRERADVVLPGHEWGLVDEGPERTG